MYVCYLRREVSAVEGSHTTVMTPHLVNVRCFIMVVVEVTPTDSEMRDPVWICVLPDPHQVIIFLLFAIFHLPPTEDSYNCRHWPQTLLTADTFKSGYYLKSLSVTKAASLSKFILKHFEISTYSRKRQLINKKELCNQLAKNYTLKQKSNSEFAK